MLQQSFRNSNPSMSPIQSGKVLVSGANGFIAVWVVRKLLEAGFSVRGTVRSADKGTHLTKLFAAYGSKFELSVVPDITQEGAFDDAVKGVDAIEHTASPFHLQADDPAELSVPAIQGTVGILESARKYGSSVKRVVVTSSCAAVMHPSTEQLDEYDWNEDSVKNVEALGAKATNPDKYRNSKTLAERAAWQFLDKHVSEVGWDLAVMNPPLVLGPLLHEVSSPSALNTSAKNMYDVFTVPGFASASRGGGGNWVDVRDLATAHVRALQRDLPAYTPLAEVNKEQGRNVNRFILNGKGFSWQQWLDAVPGDKYEKGTPGSGTPPRDYINNKAIEVLGMEYRSMEETARDVVADWEARGWA
ncbi:D-lactaldehyde dehydrogenase [Roridomyces roridus]|uniref:D-lactaldehyde dehydrogenase n=1 Tax=Roridomyces roridus TaxID=1738132 RepID=A0AAD7C3H0_9AGAR|nr:D-lactaldehyde dehydrogenase [Roridomyces roridus]